MRHGRLFWRIYLHGIAMLVLITVAGAVMAWLFGHAPAWRAYPERLAVYLSARAGDLAHPEVIERDLKREHELLGVEATVYRLDNSLVASSITPPIAPADRAGLAKIAAGTSHVSRRYELALPIHEGAKIVAYVVVGGIPLATPLKRAALMLGIVLVALALGSFPLARTIASPLEQLTAAAKRLGSGDLSVRTGLKRRDEVGALAVAFDEMAGRLETLVRGEKELLANVSHELRTPMARIRVALELAAEGDAERAHRYLGEIATDLGELEHLVDDVLTTARLELVSPKDGAPPLRRTRVAAKAIVDAAAEKFRGAHADRTLTVELGAALPEVDADEAMLRRVIDNLLDNARKYSEADKPIFLVARAQDGLVVEVRDEGIGVEPTDLPNLFRPFFRTERSRSRGAGGVGLGLALARRIVEAHGGRIEVESVVGKGTTLRFRIPAAS